MHKLVKAAKAGWRAFRNQVSDFKNPQPWLLNSVLGQVASAAGINITPEKAMGVSTVYACVNVISRAMASLPIKLYRADDAGNKREIIDDVRSVMLRSSPNPDITGFDFRMAMQANLALRNNAYAQIRRNGFGTAVELIPVHPQYITDIRRDPDTKEVFYHLNGEPYPQNEILHLKGLSFTGYHGSDLIRTARDSVGLAVALESSAASFFKNGQRPGLVARHPDGLSDQAFNRLKKELEDNHTGSDNAYKFLLLEEGLDLVMNRASNRDSQFDESRKAQALEIARFFGVPPHKVGIESNLPRANVEEQNIEFVTDVLTSYCVLWEQQLNKWLLTDLERAQGHYFQFVLDGLLRGNITSRYEAYAKGRQWGWLSVNDIRKRENMNPIENGDIYLEPQNMIEAGQQTTP